MISRPQPTEPDFTIHLLAMPEPLKNSTHCKASQEVRAPLTHCMATTQIPEHDGNLHSRIPAADADPHSQTNRAVGCSRSKPAQ